MGEQASLGCLVEGDMQQLQGEFTAFQESLEQRLHERLSIQPLMAGAGGVEYLKYVLRPGSSVGDAAVAQYNGCFEPLQLSGRASRASSDADVFHITTPCIRSTALEAFVRFCFMQHLLYAGNGIVRLGVARGRMHHQYARRVAQAGSVGQRDHGAPRGEGAHRQGPPAAFPRRPAAGRRDEPLAARRFVVIVIVTVLVLVEETQWWWRPQRRRRRRRRSRWCGRQWGWLWW